MREAMPHAKSALPRAPGLRLKQTRTSPHHQRSGNHRARRRLPRPSRLRPRRGPVSSIALPGAEVALDYIVFDQPHQHNLGISGRVDVIDTATRNVHRIDGFPTREVQRDETRRAGPEQRRWATASSTSGIARMQLVCAVNETTFERGKCTLTSVHTDRSRCGSLPRATPRAQSRLARADRAHRSTGRSRGLRDGRPEQRTSTRTSKTRRRDQLLRNGRRRRRRCGRRPGTRSGRRRPSQPDGDAGMLFVACTSKVESLSLNDNGRRPRLGRRRRRMSTTSTTRAPRTCLSSARARPAS